MARVYEVARELGVSSSEVLERLNAMGEPASSHSSTVDDAAVERLRKDVGGGPETEVMEPPPEPDGEGGGGPGPTEVDGQEAQVEGKPRRSRAHQLAELPLLILLAFVIAVVIKTFLVQAFYIPSGSMIPTLHVGDRVLVEKISYRIGGPSRGDVVVFAREVFGEEQDLPWHEDARNFIRELLGLRTEGEQDFIKRVVAVGGDTIRYVGTPRQLYVNGDAVDESYIQHGRDRSSPTITRTDCRRLEMDVRDNACVVPAGMVFVMGDNRGNSEDSRSIGPVDEDKIVGKAFVIIWPPSDFGTL